MSIASRRAGDLLRVSLERDLEGIVASALPARPYGSEVPKDLTGEGRSAVYKIKGRFVTGSDHVIGTVLSMANDLARKPVGAVGPFVLFPAKA